MEPQLLEMLKVCGFCSRLTEEADSLSVSLSLCLPLPVVKLERSGVRGAALVWGHARGGVKYNRRIHGPLVFPRVNISVEDHWSAEEIFPSVRPFQCEVCQDVTSAKQDFVKHIKLHRWEFIDPEVLAGLEEDLRKRNFSSKFKEPKQLIMGKESVKVKKPVQTS